jgi:hypothetical protein
MQHAPEILMSCIVYEYFKVVGVLMRVFKKFLPSRRALLEISPPRKRLSTYTAQENAKDTLSKHSVLLKGMRINSPCRDTWGEQQLKEKTTMAFANALAIAKVRVEKRKVDTQAIYLQLAADLDAVCNAASDGANEDEGEMTPLVRDVFEIINRPINDAAKAVDRKNKKEFRRQIELAYVAINQEAIQYSIS